MYETYDPKEIHVFDPEEQGDQHFSKFTYAKQPLIVKPGVSCLYKPGHLYIQDAVLLEWFDRFHQDSIRIFHEVSKDWFEDPLTLQEVESSFLSPLKATIRDGFEVVCTTEDGCERQVLPSFHIKGIQFNSKHFFLVIDATFEEIPKDIPEEIPEEIPIEISNSSTVTHEDFNDLSEYHLETDTLPVVDLHLDKLSVYKVYEFLNQKIKDSMADEIRGIFASKKIKSRLDFSEVFDDEEPYE
jgi:hypothetical protein